MHQLLSKIQYNLRWLETGGKGSTGRLANHGSEVTLSSNGCKQKPMHHITCLLHSMTQSHVPDVDRFSKDAVLPTKLQWQLVT